MRRNTAAVFALILASNTPGLALEGTTVTIVRPAQSRSSQADWLRRKLPGIQQRALARGLLIHGSERYLERIACTTRGVPIPIEDCQPGSSSLFIDERGLVSPCSFTTDGYGVPLASLRTPHDLTALSGLFRAKRQREMLSPCQDCHCTQVFDKFA